MDMGLQPWFVRSLLTSAHIKVRGCSMEEESGCEESVDGISGGVRCNFEFNIGRIRTIFLFCSYLKWIKICHVKQISFNIFHWLSCARMCSLVSARLSFATRTGWRQGRRRQTKVFVVLQQMCDMSSKYSCNNCVEEGHFRFMRAKQPLAK